MVGNVTVLLTDEKDDYTQRLASTLRNNRMDVKICPKNGVEVLRVCDEIYPDVIIMDAFLQHIDAVGVVTRINAILSNIKYSFRRLRHLLSFILLTERVNL